MSDPENAVPLARLEPKPNAGESSLARKPHDPGSSHFWWIPGGMLATAAAAIVMWWVWPPSEDVRGLDDDGTVVATRGPLPSYVLETDGGLEQRRGETDGDEQGRHRYRRDTVFEWVLRPKLDVSETVIVRGFAFVADAEVGLPIALDELASVASSGVIRVSGKIADLKLEPGSYAIVLAIGRPEDVPSEAAQVLHPGDDAKWMARRIELSIED